jgi:hypothetical protein
MLAVPRKQEPALALGEGGMERVGLAPMSLQLSRALDVHALVSQVLDSFSLDVLIGVQLHLAEAGGRRELAALQVFHRLPHASDGAPTLRSSVVRAS